MRLLVTGAAGMLGSDVVTAAGAGGHEVVVLARADLDITDPAAVSAALLEARPDAVVNCAAWTDVDGAETAEAAATAINGDGAGHVAAAARDTGALCVQISSDYVFDGTATGGYVEEDATGPIGAYGRSKLAGEQAVLAAGGDALVVRASWLFGRRGHNFVATMLRVGAERDVVTVVDDQVGCPTWTGHLAQGLLEAAERRLTGVLHLAGGGSCSWFELAEATFAAAGIDCAVRPQSTAELGRPAPRPANSVLRSSRAGAPVLPDWHEGLAGYLAHVSAEVSK
jgi:dTDP-4-dehydrorhamnose reductase